MATIELATEICVAPAHNVEQVPMDDFSSLYRKYAPDVFRFAYYLSGERSQAEDITSETFVRIWTASERVEMATVKGYLFTIARNLFLHGVRGKVRHVELDKELRDSGISPLEQAERKEELRAVLEGLQELPEIDRAALLMRSLDGMAYEEIARALAISLSSVKVKIHRARLTLSGIRNPYQEQK
ncbi:MAG TPA: RNA polymerase sigma factor [Bryobacteraceae bacterium]|jgi:RNA polymerase sigma-70 factor (ECF subfamily)|nr:RNA polymerase sigma factor [Bryobacteraceae bacterium]